MCGRYQLDLPGRSLANLLEAEFAAFDVQPTRNASPTERLPILALARDGRRVLQAAEWGLVPAWARRPGQSLRPLINARAETVADKPAFRSAVRTGRVLVPVTAFYEWSGPKGSRVPHVIRVQGEAVDGARGVRLGHAAARSELAEPFLLAGISEVWTTPDNVPELTFTILTTEPNELCAPIHDRMPAILDPEDAAAWLETPAEATELLLELLRPFPADRMETWPADEDFARRASNAAPSPDAGDDDQLTLL